jgi:hypothetical protein
MNIRAKTGARVGRRQDRRREVPSLDALLRSDPAKKGATKFGRPLVKQALQAVLAEARVAAERGKDVP